MTRPHIKPVSFFFFFNLFLTTQLLTLLQKVGGDLGSVRAGFIENAGLQLVGTVVEAVLRYGLD